MAIVRKSAVEVWSAGKVDIAKVRATTDRDIELQMIEDGEIIDASNTMSPLAGTFQYQKLPIAQMVHQKVGGFEVRPVSQISDAA